MNGQRRIASAAIVAILLAVALLAAACSGDSTEPEPTIANVTPQGRVQGGLLHSDRSNLSVCVDGAAGFNVSDTEVEAVQAALDSGLASVPDAPGAYSEPTVAVGCPAPPAALVDETVRPANRPFFLGVVVDVPSNHLLFVYFMALDTYTASFGTASFGSAPYIKTTAEAMCTFDVCRGVTLSVYFPQQAGSDVLREGLLDILNLLPRLPDPTIDWQACERGEQPNLGVSCDDYEDYRRDLEWEQENR